VTAIRRREEKRTVAVRAGMAWSRAGFVVLLALSYLAVLVLAGLDFGTPILLPLLTLPCAFDRSRALTLDLEDLVPMTPKAAGCFCSTPCFWRSELRRVMRLATRTIRREDARLSRVSALCRCERPPRWRR
jgi:hypothetical protein